MTSKKVMGQVRKAVHLIVKEHWEKDAAVEAAYTFVYDEITLEEFTELVLREVEE